MNGKMMIPIDRTVTGGLVLSLAVLLAGCSSESENRGSQSMDDLAALLDNNAGSATAPGDTSPTATTQLATSAAALEPQVVTAKTPKKGRTLHDQGSYLSAVGSARFRAEHQMILHQVTHALNLYQAEHGYYPKSHEEFMVKIVEPNSIVLPELEEGYEYWYDASDHLLKFRPVSPVSAKQAE
jgi:hypothetical protein